MGQLGLGGASGGVIGGVCGALWGPSSGLRGMEGLWEVWRIKWTLGLWGVCGESEGLEVLVSDLKGL